MPSYRASRIWAVILACFGGNAIRAEEPVPTPPPGLEQALFPEPNRMPVRASLGEGLEFATLDDSFVLRLRLMAQIDGKLFIPGDQDPARSGVYLPRVRTYFEGSFGKSWEYEVSLQRSVEGTFDVLDASGNYRGFGEGMQFKFGRFLVPYSYDWYDHLEQFFITPERGLFPLNFGLSREAGVMMWGDLFEKRAQYAFGGFSGQLSGLADTNVTRDLVGYLNLRPFRRGSNDILRFLNLGGSFAVGQQAYDAEPLPLRTSLQSSENDEAAQSASAIFLDFFPEVVASGNRVQAALHLSWYLRHLSVEAEFAAGRFDYRNEAGQTVGLPVNGFHVGAGYFITGEEVEKRTVVKPLRPFDPANGEWGPGAIEPFARVSRLRLGESVFTGNLASQNDWTDRAIALDIGWNWYPNEYLKFYFDWQHSQFGSPVLINAKTGERRTTNDLLWVRAQINF